MDNVNEIAEELCEVVCDDYCRWPDFLTEEELFEKCEICQVIVGINQLTEKATKGE